MVREGQYEINYESYMSEIMREKDYEKEVQQDKKIVTDI